MCLDPAIKDVTERSDALRAGDAMVRVGLSQLLIREPSAKFALVLNEIGGLLPSRRCSACIFLSAPALMSALSFHSGFRLVNLSTWARLR